MAEEKFYHLDTSAYTENLSIETRSTVITDTFGFDIAAYSRTLRGPVMEIGGPTYRGQHKSGYAAYTILRGEEPAKQLFVANVDPSKSAVDATIDGTCLPLPGNCMSMLLSSCLPHIGYDSLNRPFSVHATFIEESRRCLETSGLLVLQGFEKEDIEYAARQGMLPLRIERRDERSGKGEPYVFWDAILIKVPTQE